MTVASSFVIELRNATPSVGRTILVPTGFKGHSSFVLTFYRLEDSIALQEWTFKDTPSQKTEFSISVVPHAPRAGCDIPLCSNIRTVNVAILDDICSFLCDRIDCCLNVTRNVHREHASINDSEVFHTKHLKRTVDH